MKVKTYNGANTQPTASRDLSMCSEIVHNMTVATVGQQTNDLL